jgi:hypothetical protein
MVNFLSYLFILCGRLRHSVLESSKYGQKKWRPTAVYALLWLSSVLYSFCVLICVSCAFLILLYGTKMDGGQGATWLLASAITIATEAIIIRPLFCFLEASWSMRKPGAGAAGTQGSQPRGSAQGSMAASMPRSGKQSMTSRSR